MRSVLLGLVLAFAWLYQPAWAQEKQPGALGVEITEVTKEDAAALKWDEPVGVKVVKPQVGSAGEKAGLKPGDIIRSLDGAEMEGVDKFRAAIGAKGAGAQVKLGVVREGREMRVTAILGARPAEVAKAAAPSPLTPMLDTGGHMAIIKGLTFTPDGKLIISAGEDKVIRIWDWRTGKTVRTIRGEVAAGDAGKIYAMAFSPDGKTLAVGGWMKIPGETGHHIRLYDVASGTLTGLLKGHTNIVDGLAFSPDGTRLISGSDDNTAIIWDVPRRLPLHILKGHTDDIYAVGFTPDGARAVTGSFDSTLRLWRVSDGGLIAQMNRHADKVFSLAVSPRDGTIASGDTTGEIRLWDGGTGKFLRVLANQGTLIGALKFSPDGTQLLSGVGKPPYVVHAWDVATGKDLVTYNDHDNIVLAAAISPDGKLAATGGGSNQEIHVWELATGKRVAGPDGKPLNLSGTGRPGWAVGVSADGARIGWGNTSTQISPINRGPLEFQLRLPRAEGDLLGQPEALSLSPSLRGEGGGEGQKQAVAPGGPRPSQSGQPSQPQASAAAQPPDQVSGANPLPAKAGRGDEFVRAVASLGAVTLAHRKGGNYGYDAILDISRDGKVVASIERGSTDGFGHYSYTLTPDGRSLISGGNGFLTAYDLAAVEAAAAKAPGRVLKGTALEPLARPFIGHESVVWAVATSPDGRLLISGSGDQTVRLWNLATQELIATLFHARDGEWVMYTPQGYYTGSPGGDALIGWQINHGPDKEATYVRAAQLREQFYRPDIINKAIILASASQAVAQSNGTTFKLEDLLARPVPQVRFAQPADHATVSGGLARVRVTFTKTPDPVRRYTLTVNGTLITKAAVTDAELAKGELDLPVPLHQGENAVVVTLTNAVGDSDALQGGTLNLTHTGEGALDKRGILRVLAIGVDKYPGIKQCGADNKQPCDLNYSGRDAAAFADAIVKTLGPQHEGKPDVQLLVNAFGQTQPTAANILRALSALKNRAAPNDTVVVFVAGHGVLDGADYTFMPTDAAREGSGYDGASIVPWTALESAVFGAKGRRYLFVDTCHSAGAYNGKLGNNAYYNDVVAFTATGQDQLALEFGQLKHGVFTYAIVDGLEKGSADTDHTRIITVDKLGGFLKSKARDLIQTYNPAYKAAWPIPEYHKARDAGDHVIARLN